METISVQYKGYTINYDGGKCFDVFLDGKLIDSFTTSAIPFTKNIFAAIVDYIDNEIDIY